MRDHPGYATGVDFDEHNESELAAHGISVTEALQVLTNSPTWAPNKKGRAGLWLAVGLTDGGRSLTLPTAYDSIRQILRPITGWDSTSGEKKKYLRG